MISMYGSEIPADVNVSIVTVTFDALPQRLRNVRPSAIVSPASITPSPLFFSAVNYLNLAKEFLKRNRKANKTN